LVGKLNLCTGGALWDTAAAHAVIWGDCNSAHFMPLLDVAGRQRNVSISEINGCAPIVAIGYFEIRSAAYTRDCGSQQKEVLATLQSTEISLVILSAAWNLVWPPCRFAFGGGVEPVASAGFDSGQDCRDHVPDSKLV
jgi:SGNH domain (fused to AT3 domains)